MEGSTRPTLWQRLRHLLRLCPKRRLVARDGQVLVEYACPLCAKRDVTPEAWEEHRRKEEENG